MISTRTFALALALSIPAAGMAQPAGAASASTRPRQETAQFEFLVGQWDLTVTPHVSALVAALHGAPKMKGTWRAWRALDGRGLEDELRIVDESGNPRAMIHSVRVYDGAAKTWRIAVVDALRATVSQSTAAWASAAMEVTASPATDAEGKTSVTRSRFTDITPTTFRYRQERSYDEGKKWEPIVKVEARRVAAKASR